MRETRTVVLAGALILSIVGAGAALAAIAVHQVVPIRDHVLVRPQKAGNSPGGIIIPDTAKGKAGVGKVIAVGGGKLSDAGVPLPPAVQVDDIVLFGKYAGTEITLDGTEHLILREDEILAVVEEP